MRVVRSHERASRLGEHRGHRRLAADHARAHSADQLKALAGTYVSDEAETVLTVAMSGDSLVIKRSRDTMLKLTPAYADAFDAPQLGVVIFRREGGRKAVLRHGCDIPIG